MIEKRKILIVEDDIFIRDIYQIKFTQEGFEVMIAANGIEAMEVLKKNVPNIILLDIMMNLMNGMETLAKIKENESLKEIPIIMLTNISEKEKVTQGMELGADDYLIKSHFTPSEVVEKVNALLNG